MMNNVKDESFGSAEYVVNTVVGSVAPEAQRMTDWDSADRPAGVLGVL